jgi:ABC-type proline/glycine betaine transport system ATPase subunit
MKNKLQREILRLVRAIDREISVVFHDGSMESESVNKRIYINVDEFAFVYDDEPDHIQVMKENGFVIDIMLPTYILLHEIGHVKMYERYQNPRKLDYEYEKNMDYIVKNYQGLERLRLYKALKLERDADMFAYSYYLHNYDKVKAFDNKVKDLLTAL